MATRRTALPPPAPGPGVPIENMPPSKPSPPPPLLLFVSNVKTAKTAWVEISVNDTVSLLKQYVARKMDIPVQEMVLIFRGEELKNDYKIMNCKMTTECTLHLLDLRDTPEQVQRKGN
mmetsp:Transcript_66024/g.123127  ORF Transcript_66024/g.123127 Transcript_66024/m.123127 type:complete len:118 (-) Transcript_66024:74-427(-)